MMISTPQIAGCKGGYTLVNRKQVCIDYIKRHVGDAKVLVGVLCRLCF